MTVTLWIRKGSAWKKTPEFWPGRAKDNGSWLHPLKSVHMESPDTALLALKNAKVLKRDTHYQDGILTGTSPKGEGIWEEEVETIEDMVRALQSHNQISKVIMKEYDDTKKPRKYKQVSLSRVLGRENEETNYRIRSGKYQ